MAGAKLEKTRWPGIYRRGERWAYEWTDAQGKRRRASEDTRDEASTRKAEEEERARRGDLGDKGGRGRLTVAAYALEMFGAELTRPDDQEPTKGRYAGRRGAIRTATLEDYRRHLERHWLSVLGSRPLTKLTAPDVARAVAGLAARDG